MEDRRTVEDLFMKGTIRILIATSTLAVGVNLPAHTVIIKGVHVYQNSANIEYSDLDIMQMIGRAGRPQFDTEGLAIVLCESALEHKYRALTQGTTVIESSLHRNLAEHLNSEVGLGTITSIASAKQWLRNSFLFQRIRQNANHYALGKEDNQTWEERMDDLVVQSFSKLSSMNLIEYINDGTELRSTEYGDIMSKLYVRHYTMDLILNLPEQVNMREILETVSSAEEFHDLRIRTSEKTGLNKLRQHNDIRFSIKKFEKVSDKVFIVIQAILGGISLSSPEYRTGDTQLHLEALAIFRHVCRLTRAIVEVAIVRKHGAQMKYGLELLRCLSTKAWEDRSVVLRQIEQIGEKSLKILAENGITSLQALQKQNPCKIELLLNRRPPFGQEVLASVKELPEYSLEVRELRLCSSKGNGPVEVELSVCCRLADGSSDNKSKKHKRREASITIIFAVTSDMEFIDFRRIPTKALRDAKTFSISAKLTKPSQNVVVTICSETVAGVALHKTFRPDIAPDEFPVLDTRPTTVHEMDLVDESEVRNEEDGCSKSFVRDLTKTRSTSLLLARCSGFGLVFAGTSIILNQLDNPDRKPLPNGNQECNHSCKEKGQCRHLCCKEGSVRPSKKHTKCGIAVNPRKARESKYQSQNKKGTNVAEINSYAILTSREDKPIDSQAGKEKKDMGEKSTKPFSLLNHRRLEQSRGHSVNYGTDSERIAPDTSVSTTHGTTVHNSISNHTSPGTDCSNPKLDNVIRTFPSDCETGEDALGREPKKQSGGDKGIVDLPVNSKKRKDVLFLDESTSEKKPKCRGNHYDMSDEGDIFLDVVKEYLAFEDSVEPIETSPPNVRPNLFKQKMTPGHHDHTARHDSEEGITVDEFAELDEWLNSGSVDIV
ncbi:hypothetical protein AX17_002839 [Amanita inopinata Kibby_2008]|nr:hypothetical protein AX17_002839 [Amanita inopinata Kibby_2008]